MQDEQRLIPTSMSILGLDSRENNFLTCFHSHIVGQTFFMTCGGKHAPLIFTPTNKYEFIHVNLSNDSQSFIFEIQVVKRSLSWNFMFNFLKKKYTLFQFCP